jgi:hypothetical protein
LLPTLPIIFYNCDHLHYKPKITRRLKNQDQWKNKKAAPSECGSFFLENTQRKLQFQSKSEVKGPPLTRHNTRSRIAACPSGKVHFIGQVINSGLEYITAFYVERG